MKKRIMITNSDQHIDKNLKTQGFYRSFCLGNKMKLKVTSTPTTIGIPKQWFTHTITKH